MRCCLLFLLLMPYVLYSQGTAPKDTVIYSVHASSMGSFSKTNDLNSFLLNNVVKLGMTKGKFSMQTSNGWIYGKQSDVKINNDFTSVLEADYLKNIHKLYFWGIATFDKSYSLKIDYRYQVGGGPGYRLVKSDHVSVTISDGILYEEGDVTDAEQGEIRYSVWRNSLRLKYHWIINNVVTLDGTGFIQPSISTRNDNIIKYTTTLSFKLRKWLTLTSSLTYNRLTRTDRENLVFTYGIGVNF
jgi:Protein of unknown function, DUF481